MKLVERFEHFISSSGRSRFEAIIVEIEVADETCRNAQRFETLNLLEQAIRLTVSPHAGHHFHQVPCTWDKRLPQIKIARNNRAIEIEGKS